MQCNVYLLGAQLAVELPLVEHALVGGRGAAAGGGPGGRRGERGRGHLGDGHCTVLYCTV